MMGDWWSKLLVWTMNVEGLVVKTIGTDSK